MACRGMRFALASCSRQAATRSLGVRRRWGKILELLRAGAESLWTAEMVPSLLFSQPLRPSVVHGMRRKRCPQKWTEHRPGTPTPTISPRSLILSAVTNSKPEFAGIRVFRATMGPPFSHRNGCRNGGSVRSVRSK